MSAKRKLLDSYRLAAATEQEKGTYFEELILCYLRNEAAYLKIAEALAGAGKRVLFLVPNFNLLSQTLTEWTRESEIPLHSFAVCSDSDVGKKRKKGDDTVQTFTHECATPPPPNRPSWQLK